MSNTEDAFSDNTKPEHGNGKCGLECTLCFFGFEATPGEINQMLWFMTGMVMRKDKRYKFGGDVITAVRQEIHGYNNPKPGEH